MKEFYVGIGEEAGIEDARGQWKIVSFSERFTARLLPLYRPAQQKRTRWE